MPMTLFILKKPMLAFYRARALRSKGIRTAQLHNIPVSRLLLSALG